MACKGLGVLIDTSVFVSWWDHEFQYVRLAEPIETDGFYLVICVELYNEYLRQIKKRYVGFSAHALDYILSKLDEKVGICWPMSATLSASAIIGQKDQAHIDCAHSKDCPAHLLVSDDRHFIEIKETCPIPIILTFFEFMNDNKRENACSDAKAIWRKIKKHGFSSVFD